MSNDPAVQALQMHLKNELPDDRVAMVLCLVQPLLAERDATIAEIRGAVREYLDTLGGQVPPYYRDRIDRALDGPL